MVLAKVSKPIPLICFFVNSGKSGARQNKVTRRGSLEVPSPSWWPLVPLIAYSHFVVVVMVAFDDFCPFGGFIFFGIYVLLSERVSFTYSY